MDDKGKALFEEVMNTAKCMVNGTIRSIPHDVILHLWYQPAQSYTGAEIAWIIYKIQDDHYVLEIN